MREKHLVGEFTKTALLAGRKRNTQNKATIALESAHLVFVCVCMMWLIRKLLTAQTVLA